MGYFKIIANNISGSPSQTKADVILGILGKLPKNDRSFNDYMARFAQLLIDDPGSISLNTECLAVIYALKQRKFEIKAPVYDSLPQSSFLKYAIAMTSSKTAEIDDTNLRHFLDCDRLPDMPTLYINLITQWSDRGYQLNSVDWVNITALSRDRDNPEYLTARAIISTDFGAAAAFLTADEFTTHLNILKLASAENLHIQIRDFLATAEYDVANTHIEILVRQHSRLLNTVIDYVFNSLTADDQDAIKRLTHAAKSKPLLVQYYLTSLRNQSQAGNSYPWPILTELIKLELPAPAKVYIESVLNRAPTRHLADYLKLVLRSRFAGTVKMILSMPVMKSITLSHLLNEASWANSRYANELLHSAFPPPVGTSSDGTNGQLIRRIFNLAYVNSLPHHEQLLFDTLDPIYKRIAMLPAYPLHCGKAFNISAFDG
ncbi:hypothetical protein EBR57_01235 [bacterium]|nr:hypothetical protein [bacterium]